MVVVVRLESTGCMAVPRQKSLNSSKWVILLYSCKLFYYAYEREFGGFTMSSWSEASFTKIYSHSITSSLSLNQFQLAIALMQEQGSLFCCCNARLLMSLLEQAGKGTSCPAAKECHTNWGKGSMFSHSNHILQCG